MLSVFFFLGIKNLLCIHWHQNALNMHWKWEPISLKWIPRSQNFSADSIGNDIDEKDCISNPYIFAVDDV